MTVTESTTRTLDVPGATLTYDVRRGGSSDELPLFLIGSPMGAAGFGTLSGYFPDRTLITYDPRGSERSTKPDMTSPSTPDEHADDLHRIIQEVGGPVDMFASSGGATNALALVAKHPEDVRTLVAHEPPMAAVLPDRENAQAASRAVYETYQRSGFGAGMAHFIAVVSHQGEFPDDFAQQSPPDPAMFGMPTEDDGSRTDPLMGQNMISGHDIRARLRRPAQRIDPDRDRRRRGVRGHPPESLCLRRRRTPWHRGGDLPERPRRIHGRRVWPAPR